MLGQESDPLLSTDKETKATNKHHIGADDHVYTQNFLFMQYFHIISNHMCRTFSCFLAPGGSNVAVKDMCGIVGVLNSEWTIFNSVKHTIVAKSASDECPTWLEVGRQLW